MTVIAQLAGVEVLSRKALDYYQRHFYQGPAQVRALDGAGTLRIVYWDEQAGSGMTAQVRDTATPSNDEVLLMQKSATALAAAGDADAAAFIVTQAPLQLITPTTLRWQELRAKYVQLVASLRMPNRPAISGVEGVSLLFSAALVGGAIYLYRNRKLVR